MPDASSSRSAAHSQSSKAGVHETTPPFFATLQSLHGRRALARRSSSNGGLPSSSLAAPNHVEINELREQCNAADDLAAALNSTHMRGALYELLLLSGRRDATPPSFTPYRSAAAQSDWDFAAELESILLMSGQREPSDSNNDQTVVEGSNDNKEEEETNSANNNNNNNTAATTLSRPNTQQPLTLHEVLGFLGYFVSKTGQPFDTPLRSLCTALAYVVADSSAPHESTNPTPFPAKVQRLFSLLYHMHQTCCPQSGASVFAHSFEELFRLLLQYHDPLLCMHLDQRVVNVGSFALTWIRSLFCDRLLRDRQTVGSLTVDSSSVLDEVLGLMDWLLVCDDRLLPVFVALVLLVEHRQALLELSTRDELEGFLLTQVTVRSVPHTPPRSPSVAGAPVIPLATVLPPCATLKDFVKKARIAMKHTPSTSRSGIQRVLFPTAEDLQMPPADVRSYYLSFVALPVEADELVQVFAPPPLPNDESASSYRPPHVNYMILDCRSASSFEFARLPTALHVGDEIGFDADLLGKMVQRFETAKGSHLCVLGTGRTLVEEVNLLKMIALHLVHQGFPYVSIAVGGFKACIPHIKAGKMEYVKTAGRAKKRPTPSDEIVSTSQIGCLPSTAAKSPPAATTPPPAAASGPPLPTPSSIAEKATGWGWNIMKSVAQKVESLTTTNTASSVASTSSGNEKSPGSASPPPPPAPVAGSGGGGGKAAAAPPPSGHSGTTTPATSAGSKRGTPMTSSADIFCLGEGDGGQDDDDDDELITVVPTAAASPAAAPIAHQAPPVAAPSNEPTIAPEAAAASVIPAAAAQSSPPPKPQGRKPWEDDDDLFGDLTISSSPAPKPTTTSASAARTTSVTTSEPHPFDDIFV